jgi:hypothetical protein
LTRQDGALPHDINDHGEVVGAFDRYDDWRGFTWSVSRRYVERDGFNRTIGSS